MFTVENQGGGVAQIFGPNCLVFNCIFIIKVFKEIDLETFYYALKQFKIPRYFPFFQKIIFPKMVLTSRSSTTSSQQFNAGKQTNTIQR
jgi:hypothetical protein